MINLQKIFKVSILVLCLLGVTTSLYSCGDDGDDDVNSSSSNFLKGYYYKNGGVNASTILYFDGRGNGVKYSVWESRDEVTVGTFSGVTYFSNNLNMESFVYYFVENVVTIVGIKGYAATLHVNNGVIEGFVSAEKITESENYNFVGRTFYNGSGKDMSNSTIYFQTESKCKIHAFGYDWVYNYGTHKEYYDWTEECEYKLDTHHKTITIYNSPFYVDGSNQDFTIEDYGIVSGRNIWYNRPQN